MGKCPRNTAPYKLANTLELFPSRSLNTTIIGTTFSCVLGAFDGNSSLVKRSSSNVSFKPGLKDTILDQNQ